MSSASAPGWEARPFEARALPAVLLGWWRNNLIAERARWSLWLPVFMGAGIGVYFWLTFEPPLWFGPIALVLAVATCLAALYRGQMLAPAATFAAIALGFSLAQFQAWWADAPKLTHELGPVIVEGRLMSVDPLPEGTRIVLAPSRIARLTPQATPLRVRIRLRHEDISTLLPGDWLSVRAILLPPPGPAMPGAYDFERRAYFDQLGAVGFALGQTETIAGPDGSGPNRWQSLIQATRTVMTARIRAALPGPTGAIASALITGETHAIPPADAGAFRDAGLAHILVIAGLHMGMVAGIMFFAARALFALIPVLALRYSTKKWAALAALAVTFLYMLLSSATVSSRRAFVMIALMLCGVLLDRVSVSVRTLAYAAVCVMLLSPESATGPSFQMSFAAVAGLVACYEALRPRLSEWHAHAGFARRAGLYLFGIALTTVVTTLATMPFTIYHFNRFPLYSIAANILAVPITGFWIMPWAILACLAMPFGFEAFALTPMGWGIAAVATIAHGVTELPGAVLRVPSMPPAGLVLLAVGGAWLCIWLRPWRLLGLGAMAAGYASLLFVAPPDIVISGNDKLFAVRAADGSYLPSRTRGALSAEEVWTRRAAAELGAKWPVQGQSADGRLSCDTSACVYRKDGRAVVFAHNREAVRQKCRDADLMVSPVAAHYTCRETALIDSVDTWKKGSHAVWLEPDRIRIETVSDGRGARLWARSPIPRRLLQSATREPEPNNVEPEPNNAEADPRAGPVP